MAKIAGLVPTATWIFPVRRSGEKAKMLLSFEGLAMASAHRALASIQAVGHSQLQGRLGRMVFHWVATCPEKTSAYRRENGNWGDNQ